MTTLPLDVNVLTSCGLPCTASYPGTWPPANGVMEFLASDGLYFAALILVALWVHRDGVRAGLAAAIGSAVALGLGQLLSIIWNEPRPFVAGHYTPLISHAADTSFPSDHLLVLGALCGACLATSRTLAAITFVLAWLVAAGRVYVGIHYPIDVLAGFVIGTGCGLLAYRLCAFARPPLAALDRLLQKAHLRPVLLGRGQTVMAAADPATASELSLSPDDNRPSPGAGG